MTVPVVAMLCWEVMETARPHGFNVREQEGRVVITINFQKMAVKHLDLTKPVYLGNSKKLKESAWKAHPGPESVHCW